MQSGEKSAKEEYNIYIKNRRRKNGVILSVCANRTTTTNNDSSNLDQNDGIE